MIDGYGSSIKTDFSYVVENCYFVSKNCSGRQDREQKLIIHHYKVQLINYHLMKSHNEQIYFEHQNSHSMECGRHSINNFLGSSTYTKASMQEICFKLSEDFINPHKSIFGGDYDVNVMNQALGEKGYELNWKKQTETIEKLLETEKLKGFLLNTKMKPKLYHYLMRKQRRHWQSIRKQSADKYIYFNSLLDSPITLSKNEIIKMLNYTMKNQAIILTILKSNEQTQ